VAETGGLFELTLDDLFGETIDVETGDGTEDVCSEDCLSDCVKVVGAVKVPDHTSGSEKAAAFH
jgi:hypothetical protein